MGGGGYPNEKKATSPVGLQRRRKERESKRGLFPLVQGPPPAHDDGEVVVEASRRSLAPAAVACVCGLSSSYQAICYGGK